MKPPLKAFITYSHENTTERERLEAEIALTEWKGRINLWCDAKLVSGFKWRGQIGEKIEKSDIFIYMVSADSLTSENCKKEFIAILYKNRNITIIPIILDNRAFLNHPLGQYEALPKINGSIRPVSEWESKSKAWENVVAGVRKTIIHIENESAEKGWISRVLSFLKPKWRQNAKSLMDVADLALILGVYDDAIRIYTESIDKKPSAEAYNNKGLAYASKKEYGNAIADYEKSIGENPSSGAPYNNRGIAYKNQGEVGKSSADFLKSIDLNSNLIEPYVNLANIYNRNGDYENALRICNKAIALNSNYAYSYIARSGAYIGMKQYDNAIIDCDKALGLNPNLEEATAICHNRGLGYDGIGEIDNAIVDLMIANKLRPNDSEILTSLADVCAMKMDFPMAMQCFDKAIELDKGNINAYNNRGVTKRALQDYNGAVQDFQVVVRLAEQRGNKEDADKAKILIAKVLSKMR